MPSPPDPEVPEKAKRRRFSAEYKLAILREADACTEPGQIGALLRRERLYSSHLVDWRRQRETGALEALARKRGPSLPTRPELRRIGYVGRTSGCAAAWPRPSGSSRSRGKSPSCWGSRSTRPATTSRARPDGRRRRGRAELGTTQACRALGISRATLYRRRRPPTPPASSSPRPRPRRALSDAERQAVRALLHAPRFVDLAPAEVVATLLDEAPTSPRSGPCSAS